MNEVLRGAVAGLAGTAVMPAAMAVAKVAGQQPGGSPPRKVGRKFEEAIGVRDELPQATLEASWVGQHFAYGAVAGVAYALARRRLRLSEPVSAGPLFGAALWAFGSAGWLPATGLSPPPTADRRGRVGTMIVAHLISGTVTLAIESSPMADRWPHRRDLRARHNHPLCRMEPFSPTARHAGRASACKLQRSATIA